MTVTDLPIFRFVWLAGLLAILAVLIWLRRSLISRVSEPRPRAWLWHPLAWPILGGTTLALSLGIIDSLPTLQQHRYLDFHLFHTAFALLARHVNGWVLPGMTCCGVLAILDQCLARATGQRRFAWRSIGVSIGICGVGAGILRWQYPSAYFSVVTYFAYTCGAWLHRLSHALSDPATLISVWGGGVTLGLVIAIAVLARRKQRTARLLDAGDPQPAASWPRVMRRVVLMGLLGCGMAGFLLWGALNLTAWHYRARSATAMAHRPHIIFIMVDTLRADHLGCYGSDISVTPHIDQLASESLRFAHVQAQASWTAWSVASVFTSRYPDLLFPHDSMGMGLDGIGPDLYYPTLAEVLHDQGYATSAIVSNPWLARANGPGNVQGYDVYQDAPATATPQADPVGATALTGPPAGVNPHEVAQATSAQVTDLAIAQLATMRQRPLFLYVLYMDPHAPYLSHPEFQYPPSARERVIEAQIGSTWTAAQRRQRRINLRNYQSEIGYTDYHVGRLLDALRASGDFDRSLIVFFSDHGEEFLEHGRFGHMETLYEEVLRVPLLIKLPYQRQGHVIDGTFPLLDVYPSLLGWLRVDARALGLQGDAVPLDTRLMRTAHTPIYSATTGRLRAVTIDDEKLIQQWVVPPDALRPGVPLPSSMAGLGYLAGARPLPGARTTGTLHDEFYHLRDDPLEQHRLLSPSDDVAALLRQQLTQRDTRLLARDRAHQTLAAEHLVPR